MELNSPADFRASHKFTFQDTKESEIQPLTWSNASVLLIRPILWWLASCRPSENMAMNKADFGALKCQATCSAGIYIFCCRKGDIVFERIKLGANSIHSLKSSAVAHANTFWSRVATAIQQKKRGYDPDTVLTKVFCRTLPMPRMWSSGSLGFFSSMVGRNWTTVGLRERNYVREYLWISKAFKKSLLLFSFPSVVHSHPFFQRWLCF